MIGNRQGEFEWIHLEDGGYRVKGTGEDRLACQQLLNGISVDVMLLRKLRNTRITQFYQSPLKCCLVQYVLHIINIQLYQLVVNLLYNMHNFLCFSQYGINLFRCLGLGVEA